MCVSFQPLQVHLQMHKYASMQVMYFQDISRNWTDTRVIPKFRGDHRYWLSWLTRMRKRKCFSKLCRGDTNHPSHFTIPHLCIQTGNAISILNAFSNRDTIETTPCNFWWLRIAQTISKEVDNNVTEIPNLPQTHLFLAVYYGIDIYPNDFILHWSCL